MSSSRVTNHLANERTFLAWLRTAIAMMGFGVVIVRLRYLAPQAAVGHGLLHATQLGLIFAIIGLMMVAFALSNFFAVRRAIDSEEYHSDGRGVVIFAAAILILGIIVVAYLLTAAPEMNGASSLL
jgi:putative membrane protein